MKLVQSNRNFPVHFHNSSQNIVNFQAKPKQKSLKQSKKNAFKILFFGINRLHCSMRIPDWK